MTPAAAQLYAAAARVAVLTVSTWGALLGLFADRSLAAQIHDQYDLPLTPLNLSVLCVAAVGYADVIWHDIRGRLIWPTLEPRKRHKVCVAVYSYFGATWLIKSFSALGAAVSGAAMMAPFAVSMAAVCGLVAVALVKERR